MMPVIGTHNNVLGAGFRRGIGRNKRHAGEDSVGHGCGHVQENARPSRHRRSRDTSAAFFAANVSNAGVTSSASGSSCISGRRFWHTPDVER